MAQLSRLFYENTNKEQNMSQELDTIRELNPSELDQVGGGLSIGLGLTVDASSELSAVSGLVGQVGGLVSGLVGGLTGAL
jgi:hypothetical protein